MSDNPRVRFAPSPTGEMHVGNARTALFNWLYARHYGGDFLLRIEDTDEARSARSYQDSLMADLHWLGLDWDEGPDLGGAHGPYRQSERLDIYTAHLKQLILQDLVYPCYCTEEELEEERQTLLLSRRMPRYMGKCRNLSPDERQVCEASGRKPSYRFKVPSGPIEFDDLIRGPVKFEGDAIGDFIIVRSNGVPAYHFAVVIDDHLMGITHVIRGEDHLSNTALQILQYRAFGYAPPIFAHHCLILGSDHAKLSKRHGSVSVGEFRKLGFLPQALVNYLGLLGSSFVDGREILTLSEMVEAFALERASKSGAIFDVEKLRWINAQYIRAMDLSDLTRAVIPFLREAGYDTEQIASTWLGDVIETVRTDLVTLADIADVVSIFFNDRVTWRSEALEILAAPSARDVIEAFDQSLSVTEGAGRELYVQAVSDVKKKLGVKGKQLFMPIRAALTGSVTGPELDKIFVILGKQVARQRLEKSLSNETPLVGQPKVNP